MGGDDVERLVQIAVGGGDAQPGLDGQGAQIQPVAQPAQHEHDLGVHRAGPLRRPGTGAASTPGDPAGHRPEHRCGYVEAGTMRHSGLPGSGDRPLARRSSPREPAPPSATPAATSDDTNQGVKPGEKTSLTPDSPGRFTPSLWDIAWVVAPIGVRDAPCRSRTAAAPPAVLPARSWTCD